MCRLLIAFLHLAIMATAHAAQHTLAIPTVVSRPYLATTSSSALRFREVAAVMPLVRKPIASGSPVAAVESAEADVTLANQQAAASTPPMPIPEQDSEDAPPTIAETASSESTPTGKQPAPILPDDTPRKVQSQDFLPLFRFPGSNGYHEDVTVIAPAVPQPPAPGTLPPSSATYRQQ